MEQTIKYRYNKMELVQFATFEESLDKSVSEVQFQTEVQFSFDKHNSALCCRVTVNMLQEEKPLLKAELCNYFDIPEQTKEALNREGKLEFPIPLLVQFASLGYGSIRGVLFAKTTGSPLADFVLPPVYFDKLINNPFVVG
mgnify:CR=1 FL=1